jgi:hypothetical protein
MMDLRNVLRDHVHSTLEPSKDCRAEFWIPLIPVIRSSNTDLGRGGSMQVRSRRRSLTPEQPTMVPISTTYIDLSWYVL